MIAHEWTKVVSLLRKAVALPEMRESDREVTLNSAATLGDVLGIVQRDFDGATKAYEQVITLGSRCHDYEYLVVAAKFGLRGVASLQQKDLDDEESDADGEEVGEWESDECNEEFVDEEIDACYQERVVEEAEADYQKFEGKLVAEESDADHQGFVEEEHDADY